MQNLVVKMLSYIFFNVIILHKIHNFYFNFCALFPRVLNEYYKVKRNYCTLLIIANLVWSVTKFKISCFHVFSTIEVKCI